MQAGTRAERYIAELRRYRVATMATETATIRVSRETRDLLAEHARKRGVSLASMLGEFAREAERESVLRSEREATRTDAGRRTVSAEEREWETALGDGVD